MELDNKVVLMDTSDGPILEYSGIRGTIEIDAVSECLHGKLLNTGTILCIYEGESIKEIKKIFKKCVKAYLKDLKELEKRTKKQYNL